jgi:triacylglycerol lipase
MKKHAVLNIERANHYANLAQIAYLDDKESKPHFKKLGYDWHLFIESDGAQCHIVKNTKLNELAICFRGTEPDELSDLLADLNAWPRRSVRGDGWVHSGFRGEIDKIWPSVVKTVDKYPNYKLFICGHSLGAAMATLCASRLQHQAFILYTYGSPRVGTRSFVKNLNVAHFRFVNNNDVVTRVPLRFMGYKHHGQLVYINHYGKIRKMTPWQRIKDRFRGYKSGILDPVLDHGMLNYIKYTIKED